MNFTMPKKCQINKNIQTILQVESGLARDKELEDEDKNYIRREVARVLNKHPWHIDESQKFQCIQKSIREIKNRKDIMVVEADKGNATVIMDVKEYDEKMEKMLTSFPYKKMSKDPTASYEREVCNTLKQLLYENKITKELCHALRPKGSKVPNFYCAPKIHKENCPLRPVVDFRFSPTYKLAAYLNNILKCVIVKGKYVTLNSVDFVSKIKNIEVKRGYTPMSFDVTSLFTKVPIQLTLCYMKEKLENELCWKDKTRLEIQDIIMLTELCLKGNYFQFKDTLYEQQEGAVMGSPISPIFAEFFMQKLEGNLIPTLNSSLHAWWEYVDDVFTIAKIKDVDKIETTLNNFHPSIKFTHEIMENNRIAFLDAQLTIKDNFTFGFSIYRKKNSHRQISQFFVKSSATLQDFSY